MKKLIIYILIVMTILLTQSIYANTKKEMQIYKSFIVKCAETNLIKELDSPSYTVYVDTYSWNQFNINQKKRFCIIIAGYFKLKNKGVTMVEVKSYKTGKKLAKYSAWGFKVY